MEYKRLKEQIVSISGTIHFLNKMGKKFVFVIFTHSSELIGIYEVDSFSQPNVPGMGDFKIIGKDVTSIIFSLKMNGFSLNDVVNQNQSSQSIGFKNEYEDKSSMLDKKEATFSNNGFSYIVYANR